MRTVCSICCTEVIFSPLRPHSVSSMPQRACNPIAIAIVLTGSKGDRPIVDQVVGALAGVPAIDAAGRFDLPETASLLSAFDLLVTGDTGPMHLADAVGTPVVALFGPSDPRRYGPISPGQTVLRVDLPCSPCGMVRLPPERCRGHVPDCMDGITVARVVAAASEALDRHV